MIQNVEFPIETARPGEVRRLVVEATQPIMVKIRCFTSKPPPPGYKSCPECGEIAIKSGKAHLITVPDAPFRLRGGELHIDIRDASGDAYEIKLKVDRYDRGLPFERSVRPVSGSPSSVTTVVSGMEARMAAGQIREPKCSKTVAARCC